MQVAPRASLTANTNVQLFRVEFMACASGECSLAFTTSTHVAVIILFLARYDLFLFSSCDSTNVQGELAGCVVEYNIIHSNQIIYNNYNNENNNINQ